MGVDPKWVAFPYSSRNVPSCPCFLSFVCRLVSLFVPVLGPKEDETGQNGTFRDNLGNAPI